MLGRRLVEQVAVWGRLVKFSHSIFALPFALSMLVVVWRDTSIAVSQILWILVAIVSARTAAMAANRLLDRYIDAKNPRTKGRELPQGVIKVSSVTTLLALSCVIFFLASALLGMHCFILSPLVIGILLAYSLTKRFTRYSHLVLGLALACAPGGVWYALRGTFAVLPLFLMGGVLCWVAGFDVIYSCQDAEFDRKNNLYSVPAVLGVPSALKISLALHLMSLVLFLLFGVYAALGTPYYVGLSVFGLVLLSQHRIVSPSDLSRVNAAFFDRNGLASVLFFIAVVVDVIIGAPR